MAYKNIQAVLVVDEETAVGYRSIQPVIIVDEDGIPTGPPGGGPETLALADLSDVTGKEGTGTTVVMSGSPAITTPTIASFVNANHTHANAAGGGTLDAAAIATGTIAAARHGSGTADATTFLRGDLTWAAAGGGSPFADGSAAAPSVAGVGATTTGLYWGVEPSLRIAINGLNRVTFIGADMIVGKGASILGESLNASVTLNSDTPVVSIRAGAATRVTVSDVAITAAVQVRAAVGTAAAPSVSGPAGTSGLYVTATPAVGIALSGVSKLLIDAAGGTIATSGNANTIRWLEASGNLGFGVAASASHRAYFVATGTVNAIRATTDTISSIWVTLTGGTNSAMYAEATGGGTGMTAAQSGSLTGTCFNPTAHILRNMTLGAFDATNTLVLVEDTTASTGNLQRWRKAGADMAVLSPTGNLTLAGLTASRPVRTNASKVLESYQVAADADSVAGDVATIVADHNDLLAKLRAANLLAP